MGIKSTLGNLGSSVSAFANNTLEQVSAKLTGLFNNAVAQIGSIWDGGFIGIDTNNWDTISKAIDDMISVAEEEIEDFNDLANRDDVLKGKQSEALGEYLQDAKSLLEAWVSTLRNFKKDAETAMNQLVEGDDTNAQTIHEAAANLEQQANAIRVD